MWHNQPTSRDCVPIKRVRVTPHITVFSSFCFLKVVTSESCQATTAPVNSPVVPTPPQNLFDKQSPHVIYNKIFCGLKKRMKAVARRSRTRHRPIDVDVDFVLSSDQDDIEEMEMVFLSREVESEIHGQGYVAVMASSSREAGWSIFKVGVWEEKEGKLMGRRVVMSGVNEDVRRRLGGRVLLQGVIPAPLQTVVIKVSEQDYDIVADDHDVFQQLQLEGTVFRAGKTIFTSNNVKLDVTLCEPVRQGILGEDTEIILVTNDYEHKDVQVNGLGTPFSVASQNDSDLDISQFLALPSSETDIDYDMSVEETSLIPPEDDPNSRGIPLRVCVLQRPVDKFSLDPRPTDSEDDEFRVYAHMRDIARIGVFSGDWVQFP